MPPFLLATDEVIKANVAAFYGTEKSVQGPARVSLLIRQLERSGVDVGAGFGGDWKTLQTDEFYMKGSEDMEWSMFDLRNSGLIDPTRTYVVRVEAEVTDFFIGEPRYGKPKPKHLLHAFSICLCLDVNFLSFCLYCFHFQALLKAGSLASLFNSDLSALLRWYSSRGSRSKRM